MPWPLELEPLLQALELAILSVGVLLGIRQLRLHREELQSNLHYERRRRSMEIDARLSSLVAERRQLEAVFPPGGWSKATPLEELRAAFGQHERLELSLRQLISEMDTLALAVSAGAADEDVAFELVGPSLVAFAIAFREYISDLRTSHNRPDLFIYLTTLVELRWAERDREERVLGKAGRLPFFLRGLTSD